MRVLLGRKPGGGGAGGGLSEAEVQALIDAVVAGDIEFTAAGTIAATTVQAAIEEVASEAGGAPGAWSDYTPTWTASTTNPAIGNGSLTGRYLIHGSLCYFVIAATFGSTTTFGTGTYEFSLPPGAVAKTGGPTQLVTVYGFDTGTAHRAGIGRLTGGGTKVDRIATEPSASEWRQDVPNVWANGDSIRIQGVIEIDV